MVVLSFFNRFKNNSHVGQAKTSSFSGDQLTGETRLYSCLLSVILVESFPILPAIPLRVHHPLKKDTRAILGITGAFVKCLLDGKTRIEADAMGKRGIIIMRSET